MNDTRARAAEIIGRRTEESTKDQYARKIVKIKNWFELNYPHRLAEATRDLIYSEIESAEFTEFFAHVTKKPEAHPNSKRKRKGEYQSFQHVNGFKSAIMDDARTKKIKLSESVTGDFKDFFAGYKRKVAELKTHGEMELQEGKSAFSFTSYLFIASQSFKKSVDDLSVFAHLFLILCWNLIARCNSVAHLHYQHIFWKEDSMIVVFPKHKGDIAGETSLPKHVYANPFRPEACPILAFALYEFTRGFRNHAGRVFEAEAKASESRFGKWLKDVCKTISAELISFGIQLLDIGTHSFRKGVASFVTSIPGGPSVIAVYLRAGWSLGPVQSRYILEGDGGDQLCGRAATGLPLSDPSFASLPPHFSDVCLIEWSTVIPNFESFYPDNFKPGNDFYFVVRIIY